MNETGKNSRTGRLKPGCKCPLDAPAWPECCQPHLVGVVDLNQSGDAHMSNAEVSGNSGNARVAQSVPADFVKGVDVVEGTPPPVVGGMQPLGGVEGSAGAQRRLSPSKSSGGTKVHLSGKQVKQVLAGEFKLTKKLLREQAEAYMASEGVVKAAKKILSMLDSDSEKIALAAAKDILDRCGVGKTKETITGLVKTQNGGEVPQEWLERIIDMENEDASAEDSDVPVA